MHTTTLLRTWDFMKTFTFNPEVTLGHVLQMAGMLVTVAVIYGDIRAERVRTDMRIDAAEKALTAINGRVTAHDDLLKSIAITHERITTLMEERKRGN